RRQSGCGSKTVDEEGVAEVGVSGAPVAGGEIPARPDRAVEGLGVVEDGGVRNPCGVEDRAQLFDVATGRELLDLDSQRLIVGRTLRISGEAGVGGQIRLAEGLGEDAEEP